MYFNPANAHAYSTKIWIEFGTGPGGWDSWGSWDGWDGWDSRDQQINRQLEAQNRQNSFLCFENI